MSKDTILQYREVQKKCKNIFVSKMEDYGPSWRVMRLSSLIDQLFIKIKRLRTLEEVKQMKVAEDPFHEWIAIVNYAIICLIQLDLGVAEETGRNHKELLNLYEQYFEQAFSLMERKNHDYGEAWREMKESSFVDLIYVKLLRIRQIMENEGKTKVSEGIEANLFDIINYAMFAMIKLTEKA